MVDLHKPHLRKGHLVHQPRRLLAALGACLGVLCGSSAWAAEGKGVDWGMLSKQAEPFWSRIQPITQPKEKEDKDVDVRKNLSKKELKRLEALEDDKKLRFPTRQFLEDFAPFSIRIGTVRLLQETADMLEKRYPACRRIDSQLAGKYLGKIGCSNPEDFLAEGVASTFTFSKANNILTGGTFTFKSMLRADAFVERILGSLRNHKNFYFIEYEDKYSKIWDSPMWRITRQISSNEGWLVIVEANHTDSMIDIEFHNRLRLRTMSFGDLTIGQSTVKDLPVRLPKLCKDVSYAGEETSKEYYGECMGFPYDAHIQLEFSPRTKVLKTAILTPAGVNTAAIIEDMLRARFGVPMQCKAIQTDIVASSFKKEPARKRLKMKRIDGVPATVYAGTCDNPLIYANNMRYFFDNRFKSKEEIISDYKYRLEQVKSQEKSQELYEARKQEMKNFF